MYLSVFSNVQIHVACCSRNHIVYIIKHNVSSKKSPIVVNRTNVTLYGVQPGETYTVEIIPYILYFYGNPLRITLSQYLIAIIACRVILC